MVGCRLSKVDSSAPTILPPRVRVLSIPSMFLSFIAFVLYLSCEKNENKQEKAGFGPFKKNLWQDSRKNYVMLFCGLCIISLSNAFLLVFSLFPFSNRGSNQGSIISGSRFWNKNIKPQQFRLKSQFLKIAPPVALTFGLLWWLICCQ